MNKIILIVTVALLVGVGGIAMSMTQDQATSGPMLTVYKSATCGCCEKWIAHMRRAGFSMKAENVSDIVAVKDSYNLPGKLQSCHTAVSASGYIFEGHVPAAAVKAFLANPPAGTRGLTAPGMPQGSPGMESAAFAPYDVLAIADNGETSVYRHITSPDYEE